LPITAQAGGLSVSSDGKTLAAADDQITVWSLLSNYRLNRISSPTTDYHAVVFSPIDNDLIAVGCSGAAIELWSVAESRLVRRLSMSSGVVDELVFSHDGSRLAASYGGSHDCIVLWEVNTGQPHAIVPQTKHVSAMAFSGDDKTLFVSNLSDGAIARWDTENGEAKGELAVMKTPVLSLSTNACTKTLASGGRDGTVIVWDLESGAVKWVCQPVSTPVRAVAFAPNGEHVAFGGGEGPSMLFANRPAFMGVLDTKSGRLEYLWSVGGYAVTDLVFAADGCLLIASVSGDAVCIWDTASLR
jgi:WD40 repeat protein